MDLKVLKHRLSIKLKALAFGSAPSSLEPSSTMPNCYQHRTNLYVHLMFHLTVTCEQSDFFFHAFTLAATLNCEEAVFLFSGRELRASKCGCKLSQCMMDTKMINLRKSRQLQKHWCNVNISTLNNHPSATLNSFNEIY